MSDDMERDEELAMRRRFRASLFRIALGCAFAAGYLGGVLSTAFGLPWIMLVCVLAAFVTWSLIPPR